MCVNDDESDSPSEKYVSNVIREETKKGNQTHTVPGSECKSTGECVNKGKVGPLSLKYVSKGIVNTSKEIEKGNNSDKKRLIEINEGKNESLSEKYGSEDSVQTREKLKKEKTSQIRLKETGGKGQIEADGCTKFRKGSDVSKVTAQTNEEVRKVNPDHREQKETEEKAYEKLDDFYRLRKVASSDWFSMNTNTLKEEIEQMTLCMARYVPSSNLRAAVAGKLKKMYVA